ncbi:MAG: ComEC/Rec2 family competence protein [Bacteroidetes bacterium]|nr:ComEC/Rec2 family competence protein [Bacteroidota bacterium]
MPFFRMLAPLMAGIWIAWEASIGWQAPTGIFIISLSFFLWLKKMEPRKQYRWSWLRSVTASFCFAAAGAVLCWLHHIEHHPQWIGNKTGLIKLVLNEPLSKKTNAYKAEASILAIQNGKYWEAQKGKVILYFSKTTDLQKLDYGTVIVTAKPLQPIANAGNPGGFQYKPYMLFKGITHQLYLSDQEYILANKQQKNSGVAFLFKTRKTALATLQQYIPNQRERGVAEALLLGYRDELDRGLVQMYSNTGVVHIIAISGMHLGLIYGIILLFIRPFRKYKYVSRASPFITIAFLWAFTIMVGATASVVRAALMFTFMAAAETLRRTTNVYNTLSASAFCMLCFQPFLLWDLGFQLSYAAVLGILMLYKPIANLWLPENRLLQKIGQMCAVTISAQLLTLPLSMYHFHQIPNLFLLSNIIAVPLGSIVLIGEILLVAATPFSVLATWIGKALNACLYYLNEYIIWIDAFRFSITDGTYITWLQAILLYGCIGLGIAWSLKANKKYFIAMLCCTLLFAVIHTYRLYQQQHQQKIIVYHIPGHTTIDFIHGKQFFCVGDEAILKKGFLQSFHLKSSRIQHGLSWNPSLPHLQQNENWFSFDNMRLVHYKGEPLPSDIKKTVPIDVLLIGKGAKAKLADLIKIYSAKWVVMDGSNPGWRVQRWQKEAKQLNIKVFSTAQQGAFVLTR